MVFRGFLDCIGTHVPQTAEGHGILILMLCCSVSQVGVYGSQSVVLSSSGNDMSV